MSFFKLQFLFSSTFIKFHVLLFQSRRRGFFSRSFAHGETDEEDTLKESRRIACRKCGNFHVWIHTKKVKSRARWCQVLFLLSCHMRSRFYLACLTSTADGALLRFLLTSMSILVFIFFSFFFFLKGMQRFPPS